MEHRDQVMEWTRESIDLVEEMLGPTGPEAPPDELKARWEHDLWWKRRYLDHLEMGGELLSAAEEWYQHHEHDLTIEEFDDTGYIILACRTCKDPVWASVPEADGKGMAAIYVAHLGHDIRVMLLDGGEDIVLECHTCQHIEGQDGIAIFSGIVRDWFLELWNG
jgi:hypothetical protein